MSKHLRLLSVYRDRGDYRNSKVHQVTRSSQKEFREQAREKFPFLEYASRNVLFHADKAESMGASQSGFLARFPISEWVPIHNLFEKYNTRRYSGTTTPLGYILAAHGCDHLIKKSTELRGQYAREVEGNEFPSALACAVYNGNLDTAWTLAGLDAKNRHHNMEVPSREFTPGKTSLIRLLIHLGDLVLMRKILEDRHAMGDPVDTNVDLSLAKSSEMINLLLELSVVPGFPLVGYRHKQPGADKEASKAPQSNEDFIFIRQAIKEEPTLLQSEVWDERTMLEFAIGQDIRSLVSLYLEYSDDGQSDLNAVLQIAAAKGQRKTVIHAYHYGAEPGFQNEDGCTALHLAAEHTRAKSISSHELLSYLLSKEASCVNVRDLEGRTALAIAVHCGGLGSRGLSGLLEAFLQAGAEINTVVRCSICEKHDLPLLAFLALRGEVASFRVVASDDRCNLNGRDSFGRTALSWCFAHQHNIDIFRANHVCVNETSAGIIGKQLLQQPAVDVNSRDNSGHTILEHFIRYASPFEHNSGPEFQSLERKSGPEFQSFVHQFFKFDRLDPNLRTSNQQFPLELILSLYDTWPPESVRIDVGRGVCEKDLRKKKRQAFNQHLIQALRLLLGTGRVDVDVQRRCACAKETAPELMSIILGSNESIS